MVIVAYEHYYPRFVLAAMGETPPGQNDGLVRFDFLKTGRGIEDVRSTDRYDPLSAKRIAGAAGLYSEHNAEMEKNLSQLESRVAKTLRYLADGRDVRPDLLQNLIRYCFSLDARKPENAESSFADLNSILTEDFEGTPPVYGILIAEAPELGGFISTDTPWTRMSWVDSTFSLGAFQFSRHLRATIYALPEGVTKPEVTAFWSRVKFDRTAVYAHLLSSIVDGENTIYVNPEDSTAYDILLRQNINNIKFLDALSDALFRQQSHTGVEKIYTPEGDMLVSKPGWSEANRDCLHFVKSPPFPNYIVEGFEERHSGIRARYYPYYDYDRKKWYGLDEDGIAIEIQAPR